MTNKDMEFLAQLTWYRDKIMVGFGNTPAALGIIEDVNRANAEATLAAWKRNTIEPELQGITDTLNEFYLPAFGENLIFGFASPVPEDRTDEAKQATELFNAGIITQNEARQLTGYEDALEGDEFKQPVISFNPSNEEDVPKALRGVDYKKVFRRMGVYSKISDNRYKNDLKSQAKTIVKEHIDKKKIKSKLKVKSKNFTDEQVEKYYKNIMRILDTQSERFENAANQYSHMVFERGIENIDDPEARKAGMLVDKELLLEEAEGLFLPILRDIAILSGNEGYGLIGIETPYIPKYVEKQGERLTKRIKTQIKRFATSMIATDIDTITNILAVGIADGVAIATIRNQIESSIADYTRVQASRVAQTEVLRTQNAGIEDSFIQSDVVRAKQWLTSPSPDYCEELNGKIVDVEQDFFKKGDSVTFNDGTTLNIDYTNIGFPPLHVNCRCTIIPVLVGENAYQPGKIKELEV